MARRTLLSNSLRLELELIEESILADPLGVGMRVEGSDGTINDLSGYDKSGLIVAYRLLPGLVEFVTLQIWRG